MDGLIMLVITGVFFLATYGLLIMCQRLMGGKTEWWPSSRMSKSCALRIAPRV